jgi:hypothetical protein
MHLLNQPIRHGWGENILPFAVADELNKAALTRSPLETAPSINHVPAQTMTLPPEQQQIAYLPPEVPPPDTGRRASFVALQEWEGVVTEVRDNAFTARLVDLTHSSPDEESEFSTTEISDDDVDLVVLGAIFRWSVGILRTPEGLRERLLKLYFEGYHSGLSVT